MLRISTILHTELFMHLFNDKISTFNNSTYIRHTHFRSNLVSNKKHFSFS